MVRKLVRRFAAGFLYAFLGAGLVLWPLFSSGVVHAAQPNIWAGCYNHATYDLVDCNAWHNAPMDVIFGDTASGTGITRDYLCNHRTAFTGETWDSPITCHVYQNSQLLVSYTVHVMIDLTAPVVSASGTTPTANPYGWYRNDVGGNFSCGDSGPVQSGIATDTVNSPILSSEGFNQTITSTGSCIDRAGNSASPTSINGINIDKTQPMIRVGAPSPAPNGNGWNRSDVTIPFECVDSGPVQSGIRLNSTHSITLSTDGLSQNAFSNGMMCVDFADNFSPNTSSVPVNIDKTPPVITANRTPMANPNGWNNSDVHVDFSCADSLSGLSTNNVAGASRIFGEGTNQSASTVGYDCWDNAGNLALVASVNNINVDKTRPVISGGATTSPNVNGWYSSDVNINFSCADTGAIQSGLRINNVTGGTLTSAGANQQLANGGICYDYADNLAAPLTVTGINIDKLVPTLSASPVAGTYGAVQQVSLNGSDDLSGVANTYYTTDSSAPTTSSAVYNTPITVDHSLTIKALVYDLAGNFSINNFDYSLDSTPPIVTPHISPAPNTNGWNNSGPVTVSWTTSDPESTASTCDDTILGSNTAGSDVGCTSTSAGGSTTRAVTIKLDTTKPIITGQATPAANANDWNNSNVTVSFSCNDSGVVQSGLDSNNVTGATITTEGMGQWVTSAGQCNDKAGNSANAVTMSDINIDKTSPLAVTPNPGPTGSYTKPVSVLLFSNDLRCADCAPDYHTFGGIYYTLDGSNPADAANPNRIHSTGAINIDHSLTLRAVSYDLAGNYGDIGSFNYLIDDQAPTLGASPAPGFYSTVQQVGLTAYDMLSGPASIYYTLDGSPSTNGSTLYSGPITVDHSLTINALVYDQAGNTNTGSYNYVVDTTPPVITHTVTPNANASGWNNSNPAVHWSVSDPESSVTNKSGCDNFTVTQETDGTTYTCQATSLGGTSSDSVTIKLDKTKPLVTGSASPAANSNGWNNTNVFVDFDCADTGSVQSGIASNNLGGGILGDEATDQSLSNSGGCIDYAGNTTDSATVSGINIDKTAPANPDVSPAVSSDYTTTQSASLSSSDISSSDGSQSGLDTIYYTTDGTDPSRSSILYDGTPINIDHSLTLKSIAYDQAGNASGIPANDYLIDNDAPSLDNNLPDGDYTGTQQLKLSAADPLSGVDGIYYTTDGTDPTPSSTEYDTPLTINKDMTVKAIACDKVGNYTSVMTWAYGISPLISGETHNTAGTTSITISWTTDNPATSRVVYDTASHSDAITAFSHGRGLSGSGLGAVNLSLVDDPTYDYAFTTATFDTDPMVTSHTVQLTGLTAGTTYYFRTVSHGSPESVGDEQSFKTATTSTSSQSSSTNSNTKKKIVLASSTTQPNDQSTDKNSSGGGSTLGTSSVAPVVKGAEMTVVNHNWDWLWILLAILLIATGATYWYTRRAAEK